MIKLLSLFDLRQNQLGSVINGFGILNDIVMDVPFPFLFANQESSPEWRGGCSQEAASGNEVGAKVGNTSADEVSNAT